MKYVFLLCLLALVLMGTVTVMTEPDLRSEVPVIYWVTDRNPARIQQVVGPPGLLDFAVGIRVTLVFAGRILSRNRYQNGFYVNAHVQRVP